MRKGRGGREGGKREGRERREGEEGEERRGEERRGGSKGVKQRVQTRGHTNQQLTDFEGEDPGSRWPCHSGCALRSSAIPYCSLLR